MKILKTVCVMLACVLMLSAIVCRKQKVEEKAPEISQTVQIETSDTEKVEAEKAEAEAKMEVEEADPVVTQQPTETVKPEVTPEVAKPEVKPETSQETEKPTESKPPVKSQEPAQPAEPVVPEEPAHEHNWVPITVRHEETGHYAKTYETKTVIKCGCGKVFYDNASHDAHAYPFKEDGCIVGNYSVEEQKVETGSTWVVDNAAWDEVVGYKCECGATK